jgi:hypothetical protein
MAFGSLTGTGMVSLGDRAAIRFDADIHRKTDLVMNDPSFPQVNTDVALGVGIPIKLKLSPHVAFVSGSASSSGFGHPFAYNAPLGISMASGATPAFFGEALLAVDVRARRPSIYLVTLPAGLLIAPADRIAIRVHAAWQTSYSGMTGEEGPFFGTFLLGGIDLLLALPGHIDLGASLDTTIAASTTSTRYEYNDFQGGTQVGVWMQTRFGA